MRTVCVFTGTRAEYGVLCPLIHEIAREEDLRLQLMVSGMHLSPEFGLTHHEIEREGLIIDEKVEILMSSDSPIGICKSMGLGLIGYSEAFERLGPDVLVLLGDRFEAFCAAATATVSRIPIAHIQGGEATQGTIDEPFRHSITKMSHIHFAATEEYRQRIIQLGEHPSRVFNVGALGIENIRKLNLLNKEKVEKEIGLSFGTSCILVTFHPVTLEKGTAERQFKHLIEAFSSFSGLKVIFTKANADTEGRRINQLIDGYVGSNRGEAVAFASMGQMLYLSAMKYVDAVVGNSSSGIIEAPSLMVPTVNVGDRQRGRVKARSVIDCMPTAEDVRHALERALSADFRRSLLGMQNPYEQNDTAYSIKEILRTISLKDILKKSFHEVRNKG